MKLSLKDNTKVSLKKKKFFLSWILFVTGGFWVNFFLLCMKCHNLISDENLLACLCQFKFVFNCINKK